MRGDVLALSDGRNPIAFAIYEPKDNMSLKTLCTYVDETGNFNDVHDSSRYCMVSFVFQDAIAANPVLEREYCDAIFRLGADPASMVFHSAPLIRQEDQFSAMSRNMRGKLFYQMLSFVRKSNFRFHCFFADSRFVTSASQIAEMLKKKMQVFFAENRDLFNERTTLRIYYDAGQKSVTRILDAIPENCQCAVEMVQGVRQES